MDGEQQAGEWGQRRREGGRREGQSGEERIE
jgi:hypothetical protein